MSLDIKHCSWLETRHFQNGPPPSPFVFHHFSAKTYQILAKHVTKVSIHDILQAYASLLTVAEEISHGGLYKTESLKSKTQPAKFR